MAENDVTSVDILPRVIPFYTLRTFVDAEYSAILGYALYQLAKQLTNFRSFIKELSGQDSIPIGAFIDKIIEAKDFHIDIAATIIMLFVLVMLVDDFYRRRIVSYLAPCRSVGRFSIDVSIGFFFLIAFMFIPEKSTVIWGSIGMAYMLGGIWAIIVKREANVWQKQPLTYDERTKAKIENWEIFFGRLTFYIYYRFILSFIYFLIMFFLALSGKPYDYTPFAALLFVSLFFISEALIFFIENYIISKYPSPDGAKETGMLISIFYMPKTLRSLLLHFANRKVKE